MQIQVYNQIEERDWILTNMLAYQHISQHFGSPQSNESRLKRSMSPGEMSYRKESIDYVRHIRRRSLSRSTSPARSHSPSYTSHTKTTNENHHLIKRSVSEEDLRLNHERRRMSMEHAEHQHAISHRPQILMNYHRELKDESEEKKCASPDEQQYETADEPDDDAPLDLSMGSKKRRGRADSGTDSDDSTGLCDEGRGNEGRAYKKSLMKRYCELMKNQSCKHIYFFITCVLSIRKCFDLRLDFLTAAKRIREERIFRWWPNSHELKKRQKAFFASLNNFTILFLFFWHTMHLVRLGVKNSQSLTAKTCIRWCQKVSRFFFLLVSSFGPSIDFFSISLFPH